MSVSNDDIRLSTLLSRDDVAAFNALYHKYNRAVFSNIFKLVRHQESAEDILQDVFASLWINRKRIDREKAVGGWLFVVSYNKAIKFLNRSVRDRVGAQEEAAEIAEDPRKDLGALEYQYRLINNAIESLPPKKKQVFILCKLEGNTYEEAALAVGISPNTVKEYISFSLKFIKNYSLGRHTLNAPVSLSMMMVFISHL